MGGCRIYALSTEYFQDTGIINYPKNYDFTRITEFKHITKQENEKTSIVREYPQIYNKEENIPYYPIPKKEHDDLYRKYLENAAHIKNLILVGRLAEYRYYNMDTVVNAALNKFQIILDESR